MQLEPSAHMLLPQLSEDGLSLQPPTPMVTPSQTLFRYKAAVHCPTFSVPLAQVKGPHTVPGGAGAQAPLPPQVPDPQVVEQAASAVPEATPLQVPEPFRSQRWQAGHEALPQQTPLTQARPPAQSPEPLQWPPWAHLVAQTPPQSRSVSSESLRPLKQAEPTHFPAVLQAPEPQSPLPVQFDPAPQRAEQTEPPQSTSASSPFRRPSTQRETTQTFPLLQT
jgi:hypothetical protein